MLINEYLLLKKKTIVLLTAGIFISSCGTVSKTSLAGSELSETIKLQDKYASVLHVPPPEISNVKLYRFLDQWMEVPYQYGGKSKSGVDCSGFTQVLEKEIFGKAISGSSADIFNSCNAVKRSQLTEGDLVFFKINSEKISHVGVYLMNDRFAHATIQAGVTISDLNSDYYNKYFFKGGRLK